MMDKVLKGIVIKKVVEHAAKDATKFMRKQLKDFDADMALRKVGLTTYKPGGVATGGLALLALGAAVGAIAALAFAPKSGAELRSDLMKKVQDRVDHNPMVGTSGVRLETPTARI